MLRYLRVELEKLLYSRLVHASLVLFLLYAVILLAGVRSMMHRLGAGGTPSGAVYLYLAFMLAFYPFIATVAIVFAGGAVAPELRDGTLRYSLIAPLGRPQYLLAKFLANALAVLAVVTFLYLVIAGIGLLFLGPGNVLAFDVWRIAKTTSRSPTLFSDEEILQRCLLAVPFVVLSAVALAAPAFLISTLVKSPLLAVTIPVSLFFISSIIQFSQFLAELKPWLPTSRMFFWDEVFVRQIPWNHLATGATVQIGIIAAFLGASIVVFVARDIKS